MVTPSFIPSSATCGPDTNLSFEGFEDILKDLDDEPTMKKMISDSEEEESAEHEAKFMGMCLFILLSFLLPHFPFFFFFKLCTYIICVTPLLQPLLLPHL